MMIEESETPDMPSSSDATPDVLAARRARRAEAGDPVIARRAEAAEAAVRNLETHLAALEQRLEEVGRERERIAQQLMERETDVRGAKQREYAEQQLRVEAEERGERLQREMRGQIQELGNRLEQTERDVQELSAELTQLRERDARLTPIVRELMDVAAGLRAGFERELTALREELQQQVVWERETYVRELTAMGARMEDLRFELTRTADDLRAQLHEPIDPALLQHTTEPESEREAAHRREMADALVAAVERLRARVAEVKEAEADEQRPAVEVSEHAAVQTDADALTDHAVVEQPGETVEQAAFVEHSPSVEAPETLSEPAVEQAQAIELLPAEEPQAPAEAVAPEMVSSEAAAATVAEPEAIDELATAEPLAPQSEPRVERAAEEPAVPDEPEPEAETVVEEPEILEKPVAEPASAQDVEDVESSTATPAEAETVEEESPIGEHAEDEQATTEDDAEVEQPRAEGLAAPIAPADRLAPVEPSVPGLGPADAIAATTVSDEPIALQSRLLTVPEKRISWLAPAIRKLAAER
ncbi:MAG TPA: hypothetical protein VNU24_05145, partial [Solirubrobacteraceae bacterium]|nr:hypothetical protein [Solirubrobacteraceae bacterium]